MFEPKRKGEELGSVGETGLDFKSLFTTVLLERSLISDVYKSILQCLDVDISNCARFGPVID